MSLMCHSYTMYFYPTIACLLAALVTAGLYHLRPVQLFVRAPAPAPPTHPHRVAIGVLSARENQARRQAVRETWLGRVRDEPQLRDQLLVKFVVGRSPCRTPPALREDRFACTPAPTRDPADAAGRVAAFVAPRLHAGDACPEGAGYFGADFRMNRAAVVRKLGVYDAGSEAERLTVTLYDTWAQEAVLSATFTPDEPGARLDGYRYKDVEPYLFPEGFEGTIAAGPLCRDAAAGISSGAEPSQTSAGRRLLTPRPFYRTAKAAHFPEEIGFPDGAPVAAGNFIAEPHESEGDDQPRSRAAAEREHAEKTARESQSLTEEQRQYGDILLVDEVDVYRNLPGKLLRFFQWAAEETEARWILKTDDDCLLNVDAVLAALKESEEDGEEMAASDHRWWGHFRTSWPLDVLGKWAEHRYPSPVYPAFACGAGSLLSRGLVTWLGRNAPQLHRYQGEDVSLGIWLAAVLPAYAHDARWVCGKECRPDAFVLPELSPRELRASWDNLVRCRNPCRCD